MNGSKEGRRFLKTMVMTSWLTSTIVDIWKKEKSVNIKTEKQELQRLEEERVVIERKNRGIIKESIRYK